MNDAKAATENLKRNGFGGVGLQKRLMDRLLHQRESRSSIIAQRRGVKDETAIASTAADSTTVKPKTGESRAEQLKQWRAAKASRMEVVKQRPTKPVFKVARVVKTSSLYPSTLQQKSEVQKHVNVHLDDKKTLLSAPVSRLPLPCKVQKQLDNKKAHLTPLTCLPLPSKSSKQPASNNITQASASKKNVIRVGGVSRPTSKLPKTCSGLSKKTAVTNVRSEIRSAAVKQQQTAATTVRNKVQLDAAEQQEPTSSPLSNSENAISETKRKESKEKRASFAPPMFKFSAPSGLQSYSVHIDEKNDLCVSDADKVTSNKCATSGESQTEDTPSPGFADVGDNVHGPGATDTLTPIYFKNILATHAQTLKNLCSSWNSVIDLDKDINENIVGRIRTVVGQSELLMSERFQQFSNLIDDCEFGRGEKATLCTDLQGFWEMIYLQVEDVMNKFSDLESIKNNNWNENWAEKPARSEKPLALRNAQRRPLVAVEQKTNSARAQAARQRLAEAKAASMKRLQAERQLQSETVMDKLVDYDCLQNNKCFSQLQFHINPRSDNPLYELTESTNCSVNKENALEMGELTPSKSRRCALQKVDHNQDNKPVSGDAKVSSPVNRPKLKRLSEMFSPLKPGRRSMSLLGSWSENIIDKETVNLISFDGIDESLPVIQPVNSLEKEKESKAVQLPMILEEPV